MARADLAIRLDAPDALESMRALGELAARLGGPYELAGQILAAGLDGRPEALATRWEGAMLALYARQSGSGREKAKAAASALRRYETTRWLRERKMQAAPLIHGEEGALLFTIMQSGGAVGFEAIRKIVRNAGNSVGTDSPVSLPHADPQNANQLNEEAAQ